MFLFWTHPWGEGAFSWTPSTKEITTMQPRSYRSCWLVDYLSRGQMLKLPWQTSTVKRGHTKCSQWTTAITRQGNILKCQVAFRRADYDSFVITLDDLVLGRWPAFRLHKTWKWLLPPCRLSRMLKSESTGGSMLLFFSFLRKPFLLFDSIFLSSVFCSHQARVAEWFFTLCKQKTKSSKQPLWFWNKAWELTVQDSECNNFILPSR